MEHDIHHMSLYRGYIYIYTNMTYTSAYIYIYTSYVHHSLDCWSFHPQILPRKSAGNKGRDELAAKGPRKQAVAGEFSREQIGGKGR